MAYQYPLNGGRINASIGGNSTSAGAGYRLVSTGTLSLMGGNNITLSQNGQSVSIVGGGGAAFSAGTQSAGTGTVSFANSNGITFGMSGSNQITASHNGITSQTAQTIGGYAAGNTTGQSSSSTFDARSMSMSGVGAISLGYSGSMLQVSAPGQSSLSATGAVSISRNGNTISIGAPVQSNQNVSLYALGNTTQNSSTLLNASNLSFNGLGGATVGFSNGSIQISGGVGGGGGGVALYDGANSISSGTASVSAGGALTASVNGQTLSLSVPAQSYLSGTGGISLSSTSNTIYIGRNQTIDYYQNMDRGTNGTLAVPFASLMLQRLNQENGLFPGNLTANTVLLNMTANMTATSLSASHSVSVSIGIYSDYATQLSLVNSASTSWAVGAGNTNTGVYHGPRWLSFVSSQWSSAPKFVDGGDYVFGIRFSTSNYAPPVSFYGQSYMVSNQRSGVIGTTVATNTSMAHGNYWNGIINTAALPGTISSQQLNRNNASAVFIPHIILNNRYSGTF